MLYEVITIAAIAVLSGAIVTVLLAYLMDIDIKLAVGLFSGALTSTLHDGRPERR